MSVGRKVRRLAEKQVQKVKKGSRTMVRRYITLLSDITVLNLEGDKPYFLDKDGKGKSLSHRQFIIGRTADSSFGVLGMSGMVSAAAIRVAVDKLGPGDVLELDQDDWVRLRDSTENPKALGPDGKLVDAGYDPIAAPQLLPFARAIVDAKIEDPRKKEEKPLAPSPPPEPAP